MGQLLLLILSLQPLWLLMGVLGGMSAHKMFLPRGEIGKAKFALWCGLIGSVIMTAILAIGIFAGGANGVVNAVFACIWGYIAFRDMKILQAISVRY
jgi:hypothetical protein